MTESIVGLQVKHLNQLCPERKKENVKKKLKGKKVIKVSNNNIMVTSADPIQLSVCPPSLFLRQEFPTYL